MAKKKSKAQRNAAAVQHFNMNYGVDETKLQGCKYDAAGLFILTLFLSWKANDGDSQGNASARTSGSLHKTRSRNAKRYAISPNFPFHFSHSVIRPIPISHPHSHRSLLGFPSTLTKD